MIAFSSRYIISLAPMPTEFFWHKILVYFSYKYHFKFFKLGYIYFVNLSNAIIS
jgi:hypothetical protein